MQINEFFYYESCSEIFLIINEKLFKLSLFNAMVDAMVEKQKKIQ
jgi:hypothetical protein